MVVAPMDWIQMAPDFARDGGTRDIYVQGTSIEDWRHVLVALSDWEPAPSFFLDGEPAPWPDHLEDVFARQREPAPFMTLEVGGVGLNCHFFDDKEIEFDLSPEDVRCVAEVEALAGFMNMLAKATGKAVVLTLENVRDAVILRCPAGGGEVEWVPTPS